MFNFLTDNIILVLAVVGTLLALAASLYEKIAKQKKLRILVTFISAGAIITVGTLILNDLHEKNRSQIAEELENKKKEMIKSISANVSKNLSLSQQSLTLLEQIEAKFAEVPLGDVAVKLTSPDLWDKFPDNDTLQAIGEIQSDLKYVLFYDSSKSRLLGFADASLFARELLVLQKQGRTSKIEELLKEPGKASASSMKPYFTSFNPRVLKGTTSYDVAQEMINEKFNDGVLLHKGIPWFVSLANMIKLAT
jgi:hypothetical protein